MMVSKCLPRDEEVSLPKLKKVGMTWVVALAMMPGPCTDHKGLCTMNMTLTSLSLASTVIPSLAFTVGVPSFLL